jgi:quinol monooxygenase YgiN
LFEEGSMSVIVVVRVPVDPANLERLWAERAADFQAVAEDGKAHGAIHHRWGLGDNFVLVIDEWPDAKSFDDFFTSQQTIPQLMAAAGAQGPPEVTIVEAKKGPDEF